MSRKREREADVLGADVPQAKRAHIAPLPLPEMPMEIVVRLLEQRAMDTFKKQCPNWDALAAVLVKHEALLSGPILFGAWCGEDDGWDRAPSRVLKIYTRSPETTLLAKDVLDLFGDRLLDGIENPSGALRVDPELTIKIVVAPPGAANSLWELREWHATQANMLTPLGWISWSALAASTDRLQLYSPKYSTRVMLDRLLAKVLWFNTRCDAFVHPRRWLDARTDLYTHPGIYPVFPEMVSLAVHGKVAHVYLSARNRAFKWCMRGYTIWKLGLSSLQPHRFASDVCTEWRPPTTRIIRFSILYHMLEYACRLMPLEAARRLLDQKDALTNCKQVMALEIPSCRPIAPTVVVSSVGVYLEFEKGHIAHGTILVHSDDRFLLENSTFITTYHKLSNLNRRDWVLDPSPKRDVTLFEAIPWSTSFRVLLDAIDRQDADTYTRKVFGNGMFRVERGMSTMAHLVLEYVCKRALSALETKLSDIGREFPTADHERVLEALKNYIHVDRYTRVVTVPRIKK